MPLTMTQVISNSVSLLGKKPVLSLDGQGELVNAAVQAFNFLLESSLATMQWRFAAKINLLSQLTNQPWPNSLVTSAYQYAYALPSDFLKTIRVWPQNYSWDIFENQVLYTSINGPIYMEYIHLPAIGTIPNYFWKYFVYEIAAYLALTSANLPDYFTVLDNKRMVELGIAAAIDANNRPNTAIQDAKMITNRYVTTWVYG